MPILPTLLPISPRPVGYWDMTRKHPCRRESVNFGSGINRRFYRIQPQSSDPEFLIPAFFLLNRSGSVPIPRSNRTGEFIFLCLLRNEEAKVCFNFIHVVEVELICGAPGAVLNRAISRMLWGILNFSAKQPIRICTCLLRKNEQNLNGFFQKSFRIGG